MDLVDNCYKCICISKCLELALYEDESEAKCLCYGALKNMAKETLDKLNEVTEKYPLTKEEAKELVYCLNRRYGGIYI